MAKCTVCTRLDDVASTRFDGIMLRRIPPCITLHRNLVLRHSSTKRKHMYLTRKVRLMNSLICSRRPCQVSLQLSSCDIAVVLSSIQSLKGPDDIARFSSLGPALLQMICSYYGVFAWKTGHSQHYNHTPEFSLSRGQHRCNTRLGGWTQINIKDRNNNRVLLCAS